MKKYASAVIAAILVCAPALAQSSPGLNSGSGQNFGSGGGGQCGGGRHHHRHRHHRGMQTGGGQQGQR